MYPKTVIDLNFCQEEQPFSTYEDISIIKTGFKYVLASINKRDIQCVLGLIIRTVYRPLGAQPRGGFG